MASMLLRGVFSDAVRAAPSAASAASRCAAVAAPGSGGAAASNRLLHRFPIFSRSLVRGLSSEDCGDSPVAAPPPGLNRFEHHPNKVKFVADEKDLVSDKALWALYERWCRAFGEERDQDEMRRRFNKFKESVFLVDRSNKEAIRDGRSVRLGLNRFADGKRREEMAPKVPMFWYLHVLPRNTNIFVRAGMDLVEEPPHAPLGFLSSRKL